MTTLTASTSAAPDTTGVTHPTSSGGETALTVARPEDKTHRPVDWTQVTHNLYRDLNATQMRADMESYTTKDGPDLIAFQEASGPAGIETVRDYAHDHDYGLYLPNPTGNGLLWRKATYGRLPPLTTFNVKAHPRCDLPHVVFNPARFVVGVGLTDQRNGKTILAICVHPSSGALKPENTTPWGPPLNQWKNWSITKYWLDTVKVTARAMHAEAWDAITLLGDFNGMLSRRDRWYYPGVILQALYRVGDETDQAGDDHHLLTHDSDAVMVRRWQKPGHTDHALEGAVMGWHTVADGGV